MTACGPRPSTEQIRSELECLRRGPALGHPGVVRSLSPQLQDLLLASQGSLTGQAQDVPRILAALRRAIDALAQHERLHAQVEFNLLGEHSYPTLGQRQESLAALLGCTAKTPPPLGLPRAGHPRDAHRDRNLPTPTAQHPQRH